MKTPPGRDPYFARSLSLAKTEGVSGSKEEDIFAAKILDVLEPRSVCFADIPFNYIPIHWKRYSGIGLGFSRAALQKSPATFRSVSYLPPLRAELPSDVARKFLCTQKYLLGRFVKIQTDDEEEKFEKIYLEREWRSTADIPFTASELRCLVFETKEELLLANDHTRYPKTKELIDAGVGCVVLKDFFTAITEAGSEQEEV